MYNIIDSHCHIYPDSIAQKASDGTGNFYSINMTHNGTVDTLLEEGAKAGISRHLVQSVATTPKQVKSINNFIAKTVAEHPDKFTGLGTLHPESEDIERDFNELLSLGLKGIKLHPDIQGFKLDDYRCLKMYELCEKNGLPVLVHAGDYRYDFSNPNRLKPLLEIFTDLKFIGAHFGGWSIWDEATKELAGYKNLYVDTSSTSYACSHENVKNMINAYGSDRVLFGVDYPMWNPKTEVDFFMGLNLSDEDNKKILHDNAVKLFKL